MTDIKIYTDIQLNTNKSKTFIHELLSANRQNVKTINKYFLETSWTQKVRNHTPIYQIYAY